MMIEPDRREILRYMGCRWKDRTDLILERVDEAVAELNKVIAPKHIYGKYVINWRSEDEFDIANMHIKSRNLGRNLRGCDECYIMAATLGIGPDRLIRRSEVSSVSMSVIYQAASAAMIEAYCNEINEKIIEKEQERGRYLRPRFSPGYGDFSIEYQRNINRLLQMSKTVGIDLTEGLMMMPSKSVTALMGVSDTRTRCVLEGCEVCSKTDCTFRRC